MTSQRSMDEFLILLIVLFYKIRINIFYEIVFCKLPAIAGTAGSKEAQQVQNELSEKELGTLGSGVAKNWIKAVGIELKAVGVGMSPRALAAVAIGTALGG